jgi:mannonate dehydratase
MMTIDRRRSFQAATAGALISRCTNCSPGDNSRTGRRIDGLKRFLTMRESPYHGFNFCLGTIAEMLQDPAAELCDIIRYFGSRKKVFNIHYRNIQGRRDNFREVYLDNRDVDMLEVMRTLKEVDYPYLVMPDHVPRHSAEEDRLQAFAFSYGYIRAMIQAVQSES